MGSCACRCLWILFFLSKTLLASIPGHGASGEPSCHQVREIIQWSAGHYGGGSRIDLKSALFASKVSSTILERLDPRHLLFLQTEADELGRLHSVAWSLFVDKGSCAFYEEWIPKAYQNAERRLSRTIRQMRIARKRINSNDIAFAGTADALKDRVWKQMDLILKEARPDVLKFYGDDKRAFVNDNLGQLLFDESSSLASKPRLLLSKAVLGAMDSFSTYLSDAEFMDLHEDLSGGTTGVGVLLRKVPMGLFIESLIAGAPAETSGKLQVGDVITAVDGVEVGTLLFSESRKLFRGTPRSEINLKITRNGQLKSIILSRAPFSFDNAKVKAKRPESDPTILVIDIPSFYASSDSGVHTSSAQDLRKALLRERLHRQQPAALVLDVRGNPGGYLEEAVEMAGLFVGEKPVVSVIEHRGQRTLNDVGAVTLFDGPIVVLQDGQSASAAEILAGALRDYEKAVVVGAEASFGKGSVQRLYDLDEETTIGVTIPGVVKLTTSVFYTPLGHSPSNGGISADIVLSENMDQPKKSSGTPELAPVIEQSLLARIRIDRVKMDSVRAALKNLSQARLAPSEAKKSDMLGEAVRVASDWVAYERQKEAGNRRKMAE